MNTTLFNIEYITNPVNVYIVTHRETGFKISFATLQDADRWMKMAIEANSFDRE